MPTLRGARVALLEARMSGELADLVTRYGGRPYSVPAVREVPLDEPGRIGAALDKLCADRFFALVFLTGVGVTTLLRAAERLGRLADVLAALRRSTVVCRGPKPVAALRRHAVSSSINAPEPYTTTELLATLSAIDLSGRTVALFPDGESHPALVDALARRGAIVEEIRLYEWRMPDDAGPIRELVNELVEGRVDAVAFTSQVQCRHLFHVATELGLARKLADDLNARTIVAAVGPVCSQVLRSFGVTPRVMPASPKMGPLILALAEYLDLTREPRKEP